MPVFKIYYGSAKPIRATGKHCIRLLQFAEKYRGWHSYKDDRTTRRAIDSLKRIGCIEVSDATQQFKFKYPE